MSRCRRWMPGCAWKSLRGVLHDERDPQSIARDEGECVGKLRHRAEVGELTEHHQHLMLSPSGHPRAACGRSLNRVDAARYVDPKRYPRAIGS